MACATATTTTASSSGGAWGANTSAIAQPLASPKLTRSLFKLVHTAAKAKLLRRGVREVVKCIRKGHKGVCVLAGDISPIDVIVHIPILCEEADIPYIFTPSRAELGAAGGTKRPTSVVLISPGEDSKYQKKFLRLQDKVQKLEPVF